MSYAQDINFELLNRYIIFSYYKFMCLFLSYETLNINRALVVDLGVLYTLITFISRTHKSLVITILYST